VFKWIVDIFPNIVPFGLYHMMGSSVTFLARIKMPRVFIFIMRKTPLRKCSGLKNFTNVNPTVIPTSLSRRNLFLYVSNPRLRGERHRLVDSPPLRSPISRWRAFSFRKRDSKVESNRSLPESIRDRHIRSG